MVYLASSGKRKKKKKKSRSTIHKNRGGKMSDDKKEEVKKADPKSDLLLRIDLCNVDNHKQIKEILKAIVELV